MSSERPLVIQTEHLDEVCAAWLAERCEVVRCSSDDPRFAGLLARAEGLVIRTYTRVDAAMLRGAPRLRVVGRAGVGVDNVDLAACAARGVVAVNTPAANTRAVVEYVTAMMMDAIRSRVYLADAVEVGAWKEIRSGLIAPRQAAGSVLGIVGLGKIGSQVARVGAALDMRVVYHDIAEIPAAGRFGAEPVSMEELLGMADVLTVHVDGRRSNRGLLGAGAFARMKPEVVLINTSRGFVVDAEACAAFMRANPGARAMLDVHEPEPFAAGHALLGMANVRMSPHIAAATAPAHRNMSWVVRDVWRVLNGEEAEFLAREEE